MKILFLIPYPLGESPSQRFRFEQYFSVLLDNGYTYSVQCFLNSHDWKIFFKSGRLVRKSVILFQGFCRRLFILFNMKPYDIVFIHRETSPIGPPVFEWVIAKILRKKIIYDFDDAIWLTDRSNEPFHLRVIKWRSKVAQICSWSHKVSCGNDYLRHFARPYNKNVFFNPTTIDTQELHKPEVYSKKTIEKIIIGWTGSHSTLKYLNELESIFQHLEATYPQVEYWVIADKPPQLKLKNLQFKPWSLETEITDLEQFDIGVMPLPDDEWSKGKCGFKALQYMALQIPTVASSVGVNIQIIQQGENGFLCRTAEEWTHNLSVLIENKALRDLVGIAGRKKVEANYSVSSNTSNFLSLFSS